MQHPYLHPTHTCNLFSLAVSINCHNMMDKESFMDYALYPWSALFAAMTPSMCVCVCIYSMCLPATCIVVIKYTFKCCVLFTSLVYSFETGKNRLTRQRHSILCSTLILNWSRCSNKYSYCCSMLSDQSRKHDQTSQSLAALYWAAGHQFIRSTINCVCWPLRNAWTVIMPSMCVRVYAGGTLW